jgi:hypothetical protein
MNEQKQNRKKEAADGTAGFAMPDCCGPMMVQMMKAFGTGPARNEAAEANKAGVPSCCESMMIRMRESFSETTNSEDEDSSSDKKGSGCCP